MCEQRVGGTIVYCLKDWATTEIYTGRDTLALHDDLPSSYWSNWHGRGQSSGGSALDLRQNNTGAQDRRG